MTTSGDLNDIYKPQAPNVKRKKFLQGVPAEYQDLYRSGDRFTVQNASCLIGKGNKIYDKITFRAQKPTPIVVFSYDGDAPIDDYSRSCIHAYALSSLHSTDWQEETNPSFVETLGAIITILATYTPYTGLKSKRSNHLLNQLLDKMATSGDLNDVYQPTTLNVKRRQFLLGIPAEHQSLYRSGDRFTIQNASCLIGKGNKIYDKIAFLPQKPVPIVVFTYERNIPIDDYSRSCIHAYALSSLYSTDWQEDTNPVFVETLGAIITILASYTPYSSMRDAGLETFLLRCHIIVEKTSWSTLQELQDATKEVRDAVARSMGLESFDATPQACTVVALSTLILIGKNVTEVNRDGWFKNRWRALAHVASVSIDPDRMEPPLLRPCQAIYSASSSNQPVRSCLFKIMRSLATLKEDQNHVLFDRIIRLLQWAEMSHVWMIMEYVYSQNPDILNFPELHGPEIATMMTAIDFLKRYPNPCICPFIPTFY